MKFRFILIVLIIIAVVAHNNLAAINLAVAERPGDQIGLTTGNYSYFDSCSNSFTYETWNSLDFTFMGESWPVPANEYFWDFGDGSFGNGQTVLHTYVSPPAQTLYIVTLTTTVIDSLTGDPCTASSFQEVYVGNAGDCINWFEYSTNDEWTFSFTGNVIPEYPTIWQWDFGDGSTGIGQQVIHTYEPGGIAFYEVCLTTYSTGNFFDTCVAFSCENVWVGGIGPDCENWFLVEQISSNSFQFHGESAPVPAQVYLWDFGDGQTGSGQDIIHNFPPDISDLFHVFLTTISSDPVSGDSCVAYSDQWIQTGGILNCDADFIFVPDDQNQLNYFFYDNSGENISSRFWDFGDGTISTETNPVHLFPGPGLFDVCLTITRDSLGLFCTDMSCTTLNIEYTLLADFAMVLDTISGLTNNFYFTDNSVGDPGTWLWNFGDGQFSTDQNPTHQFDTSGIFEICLEVSRFFPNMGTYTDQHCKNLQTPYYYDLGGLAFIGDIPINNPFSTGDTGVAYLYRKYDNAVVPADTNDFYEFGYYWFSQVREGNYIIKAGLTPNSEHFNDFAPAYYEESLYWEQADILNLTDSSYYYADVHLTEIPGATQGIGIISGILVIHTDSVKDSFSVSSVPVFLLDESGSLLTICITGEDGSFSFNNIALGTYSLYAEATGLFTNSLNVSIDLSNPVINDIELDLYEDDISGFENPVNSVFSLSPVYPNPVNDIVYVNIESGVVSECSICLFNISGQRIYSYDLLLQKGRNIFSCSASHLSNGIYFFTFVNQENSVVLTRKLIKQ